MHAALLAIVLIVAAFLTALAVLVAFDRLDRRQTSRLRRFSEEERDAIVFIFDNETLLDATPAARHLLATSPRFGTAWAHLAEIIGPRFPKLTERMKDLADFGELELRAVDGSGRLWAQWHDGVARIRLESDADDRSPAEIDRHSYLAMSQELESLRATAEHTPYALWRETASGTITWCNAAYLAIADSLSDVGEATSWPPARAFDITLGPRHDVGRERAPDLHRVAITPKGENVRHWFEVSVAILPGGDRFCAATPVDRLVKAETALNEFVATLTKTFAALPIGLAIFNRARELTLFNPALMDLTVLPAEFLISRPSLSSFLDKLREARMIPEPRDYKSWRQQMSDLVVAAENGSYEENWSLPTGQTYRVTGRPHPDGAVAFLFEDISAEVSISRRFRMEIEAGHAVLDALPQAIAVFTPAGILSMSNLAYSRLWGRDPSTSLSDLTLFDALRGWQSACPPSPIWDHLRSFAAHSGPREAWTASVYRLDGRALACTVTPLSGGATMVSFSVSEAMPTVTTEQPEFRAPFAEVMIRP